MPQYGKLKIDQFLYNNSGSDVTIDLANLALKANPTFTGTVTVPTVTAGDNSTKAASTAFVVASFAPKVSPTFSGTVTVPTASANDNTTKAASTAYVQTELGDYLTTATATSTYAPKANPAFTGSATGVNLTLSGDLTVNGTTTTINTTTLQVEDKNIEIGKVSSPSDTTADGGGWTLLGATNKTFNWVNATDAWTSSEHINLGDDKKLLLGTGQDLEIYHGSNSWNYITSPTSRNLSINPVTGEAGIQVLASQGVKLFYDNSQKLETTSGGINVTGAINVNGSALSTAPQITATASGAITAGKPVIVNSNGTVSQVGESFTALSEATFASNTNEWTDWNPTQAAIAFDSANMRALVIDIRQNNSERCMAKAGSVVAGDIAWSTDTGVWSQRSWCEAWGLVFDDSCNKFIAIVEDGTSDRLWAAAITVNGTAASDVTWGTIYSLGASGAVSQCSVCYDSNANVTIVAYRDHSDSNKTKIRALSCNSSGVISMGAVVEVTGGTCNATNLAFDSVNNKSLLLYRDASHSNSGRGNVVSVSGTTISLGSQVTFDNSSPESGSLVFDPDTGKFAYFYYYATGGDHYGCRIMQISGTSFNYGSSFLDLQTSWNPQTDHRYRSAVYDSTLEQCIIFTRNSTGAGFKGHWYRVAISSSNLTASEVGSRRYWSGSDTNTESNSRVTSFGAFYDTTHRRIQHIYQNESEGNDGFSQAMLRTAATSNLTSEGYVGVAAASASNTASATIDVSGATNSNQSSLTPGQKYYVQGNGTLGLTASSPAVFAGTAISSTKMIVNDQPPAPAWEILSTYDFAATNASQVIQRGWTNANYSQFKLVWADLSGGANNTYRTIRLRFYISGNDSAQGTEYSADPYYKSFRQKGSYTGTGLSGNNRSDTEWRLNNDSGMRWGSGEIVFPATTYNGGGWRPIHAYGRVCSEGGSDFCGCELAHPISSSSFLNGVKVYSNGNWTTGRMTWYGLRNA